MKKRYLQLTVVVIGATLIFISVIGAVSNAGNESEVPVEEVTKDEEEIKAEDEEYDNKEDSSEEACSI